MLSHSYAVYILLINVKMPTIVEIYEHNIFHVHDEFHTQDKFHAKWG